MKENFLGSENDFAGFSAPEDGVEARDGEMAKTGNLFNVDNPEGQILQENYEKTLKDLPVFSVNPAKFSVEAIIRRIEKEETAGIFRDEDGRIIDRK